MITRNYGDFKAMKLMLHMFTFFKTCLIRRSYCAWLIFPCYC